MRPGREIDVQVAQEIFQHQIIVKKKILHEITPLGERPLRNYAKEIQYAWTVAEQMRVSLIAIEGGNWFALAGKAEGWGGPEALLHYLKGGNFANCGAAVGDNAALVICQAALVAREKQKIMEAREELSRLETMQADQQSSMDLPGLETLMN